MDKTEIIMELKQWYTQMDMENYDFPIAFRNTIHRGLREDIFPDNLTTAAYVTHLAEGTIKIKGFGKKGREALKQAIADYLGYPEEENKHAWTYPQFCKAMREANYKNDGQGCWIHNESGTKFMAWDWIQSENVNGKTVKLYSERWKAWAKENQTPSPF